MTNPFLALLRQNFRFGRMCNPRTAAMAGCCPAPAKRVSEEPSCHSRSGSQFMPPDIFLPISPTSP